MGADHAHPADQTPLPPTAKAILTRPLMKPVVLVAFLTLTVSSCVHPTSKRPPEFVTQILEPTGGKVQRPSDWFYTESHNDYSYTWILSREDASKKPYTTGVRIQALVGVQERTGKSPREFSLEFLAGKQREARVISTCPESDQGLFTRVCLETEEGPHHIQYSVAWGKQMDMVVVTIAGTTKQLWDKYRTVFNAMEKIELIDMKKFEK